MATRRTRASKAAASEPEPEPAPAPAPVVNGAAAPKTNGAAKAEAGVEFQGKGGTKTWGREHKPNLVGTLVVYFILVFCPVLPFYCYTACTKYDCSLVNPALDWISKGSAWEFWENFPQPSLEAFQILVIWALFQAVMYVYLPGPTGKGQMTPAGKELLYNVNGLRAYILTHVLFVALSDFTPYSLGLFRATIVADHYAGLMVACCAAGYIVAAYAYAKAHLAPTHPEDRKFTGNFIYDVFWGVEFNPREQWLPKVGQNSHGEGLDWKLFWVGRHGMMMWSLINLSLAVAQHRNLAANPGTPSKYSPVPLPNHITNSMVLLNVLHTMYIADFFYSEDWYLRTIDIAHDHFGFMFAWGDSTWLTFIYALQSWYLLNVPIELPPLFFWTTVALGLGGYAVFRIANNQKDLARSSKGKCTIWGKPATFVKAKYQTSDGKTHETLLLTSGFWGIARHSNYTGDLMGCLAYGMSCGAGHIMPYFYFVYMTILLLGRNRRDETRCAGKYGKAWEKYVKEVPYVLIPGIY